MEWKEIPITHAKQLACHSVSFGGGGGGGGSSFSFISVIYFLDPIHKTEIKQKKLRRKGNPLTLLVGMQTSTTTMENRVEIP